MSTQPIVVKLGGDALASPERIVAQARRLARWAEEQPVVAVASARRGVTDHLLGLVAGVETAAPALADAASEAAAALEADRAVASGEVVSASLLALALIRLGRNAVSFDAREAGILARGARGEGRIRRIRTGRIGRILATGGIPVVTGFQGWRNGRVVTLGRGGSDTSAVALALALDASKVVFVKDAAGLRTADPKVVPDTAPIREAPHRFLTALTRAGSRVVHHLAAELAEEHELPLEFWTLDGETPETVVHREVDPVLPIRAAASLHAAEGATRVSVLGVRRSEIEGHRQALAASLREVGVPDPVLEEWTHGFRLTVPSPVVAEAVRTVHRTIVASGERRTVAPARRAS